MIDTLKTNGVTINGKHSYNDYGLIMTSKSISYPEAQLKYVSVPGRNGAVDFTEVLTGDVRYNNRTITMTFFTEKEPLEWAEFISLLRNKYQGNKSRIVFDDDIAFYWLGRVDIDFSNSGRVPVITITALVDPYKYNITTSAEDWLWDPFDFDMGVINEFSNVNVNGTYTANLICTGKVETPIITVSSAMTAELDDDTIVSLSAGQNIVYDFVLDEGEHTIVLTGNGTATINYSGGSL